MKYSLLFSLAIILVSCTAEKSKIDLVVYPQYCGGCVTKNFSALGVGNTQDDFNIYFDTTDRFILDVARINKLEYTHIDSDQIPSKFGDYANLVLFSEGKDPVELKTNEVLEKGKHY